VKRVVIAALGTAAVAAATVLALPMLHASAATGGVTGFATQNGGTRGGQGGSTVRATTGTAIHHLTIRGGGEERPGHRSTAAR